MSVFDGDCSKVDWEEINDLEKFRTKRWTEIIEKCLSIYKPGTTVVDEQRRSEVVGSLGKYATVCIDRLRQLEKDLKKIIPEKAEIIEMMIVCAIAHQPMLMIGPPGTAKSMLVLKFC